MFLQSYPYQLKDVATTTVLELDQIGKWSWTAKVSMTKFLENWSNFWKIEYTKVFMKNVLKKQILWMPQRNAF